MADQELPNLDEIMLQNEENERKEAQKSQSQPKPYEASQPKPYEVSQPQPYQPLQSQPYEVSQPQPYQAPQSQFYQAPQSQPYQPAQSQPQAYQQPLPQNQTPLYINPSVANNTYQGGSNLSQNYVMNPNSIIDNPEIFHDDIKAANKRRLKCQLFLVILLFLNIPISIFSSYKNKGIILTLSIIVGIFSLIIGIWMIILTKRGQTTRNCCLGLISLISLIILIAKQIVLISDDINKIKYDSFYIIILIILVSYNMKCKCCD